MNASQGNPARIVIFIPGIHHVEISTPIRASIPASDDHGPGGAKRIGTEAPLFS
jgi:hypothetical protein